MIRLNDPLKTFLNVTLPDDLHWVDEFDWSPQAQTQTYTIGGSLVLEEGTKLEGRTITLGGAYDDMGWVTRATINDLIQMRDAVRDATTEYMTLTLWEGESYERTFNVVFNQVQNSVEAKPVIMWNQTDDANYYTLVLRLLEV